jgi:hypothetical protein
MYAGVLPTHLTHPMCNPLCSVRACANRAFADSRDMDVEVFGSFANGLSTWSSDVDVCVTGLMTPDKVTGCECGWVGGWACMRECECVYVFVRVFVDVCVMGLMTADKVTGCECECVYVLVRVCVCACVYACLC